MVSMAAGLVLGLFVERGLADDSEITVAADGSGKFKTVQEAVMSVPEGRPGHPVVIHIKPGTYKELVYIQREKRFFRLVGEDPEKTILTYNLNANLNGADGKPIGTFRTPTVVIDADDFVAENITFENSAGPVGQALAIRLDGDRAIFRNCRFLGWQDTILANNGRHYFENCTVAGHVDFIFGGATAFFEKCHIHCLDGGYITAASTPQNQPYGFVFSDGDISTSTASPGRKFYLGRPWRPFAAVTFMRTEMPETIAPPGWRKWRDTDPDDGMTARYTEYKNTGPGARPAERVAWSKQLTDEAAAGVTVEKVLAGADGWNPLTVK